MLPYGCSCAAIFKAQLSDSEPPDVKKISSGPAPIVDASSSLACVISFFIFLENVYMPEGLPYLFPMYGSIALTTSGCIFVVAALSIYILLLKACLLSAIVSALSLKHSLNRLILYHKNPVCQ